MVLGNSPRQRIHVRLERRRSFVYKVEFKDSSNEFVPLAGSVLRMSFSDVLDPDTVHTFDANGTDSYLGEYLFELQASDTDLEPGTYNLDLVLLMGSGYSIPVAKGALEIVDNSDPLSTNTYSGLMIDPQGLTVTILDSNVLVVCMVSPGGLDRNMADGRYLRLTGGEMIGPLVVLDPSAPNHPATKKYVDEAIAAIPEPETVPPEVHIGPDLMTGGEVLWIDTDEDGGGGASAPEVHIGPDQMTGDEVLWVDTDEAGPAYATGDDIAAAITEHELDSGAHEHAHDGLYDPEGTAWSVMLMHRNDFSENVHPQYASKSYVDAAVGAIPEPPVSASEPLQTARGSNVRVVGNGWSPNAASLLSSDMADPDNPWDSSSIRITTKTDGTMAKVATYGRPATSTTSGLYMVLVKVDDVTALDRIQLYVGGGGFAWYEFLNVAFGGTEPNTSIASGRWAWLPVTRRSRDVSGAQNPAAATDWQIAVTGAAGRSATVRIGGIVALPSRPYPNGVVSIIFDDGYSSVWSRIRPTFAARGIVGGLGIIPTALGTGGYMSEAQVREMYRNGWDIHGHSVRADMLDLTALTPEQQDAEGAGLRRWLDEQGFVRGADMYIYPQGRNSAATDAVMGRYFSWARTTYATPAGIPAVAYPMRTGGFLLDFTTLAAAKADMDAVKANGEWRIYVLHDIQDTASSGVWSTADLGGLLDYAAAQGIPVVPWSGVARQLTSRSTGVPAAPVIVLGATDPVPPGTAAETVIVRRTQ